MYMRPDRKTRKIMEIQEGRGALSPDSAEDSSLVESRVPIQLATLA